MWIGFTWWGPFVPFDHREKQCSERKGKERERDRKKHLVGLLELIDGRKGEEEKKRFLFYQNCFLSIVIRDRGSHFASRSFGMEFYYRTGLEVLVSFDCYQGKYFLRVLFTVCKRFIFMRAGFKNMMLCFIKKQKKRVGVQILASEPRVKFKWNFWKNIFLLSSNWDICNRKSFV